MQRSIRIFLVLAASAAGPLLAGDASAQPRPAITRDVDAPGRQPYQTWVEFSKSSCSLNCTNFFNFGPVLLFDAPPVPAGKRLVVQWVSAELPSDSSINSISFQTSPVISNQSVEWQYHGPFFPTNTDANVWGMSSAAFFTVEPGESPHIRVKLGAANNFVTNIAFAGYLIDAD